MSYIADNTTRAKFLAERNIRSRQVAQVALNQFDIFCKFLYQKNGDTIIRDIGNTGISDKAYTVMNQFCMWLGEDHQELQVIMGKSSRPMRKIQPTSCASNDDLCSSIFCSECNDTISYDAKQLHISV